jgi:fatty acid desaturase
VSSSLSASSGSAVPNSRVIRTGPRGIANPVSEFSALLNTVRDAGLLRRRKRFYIINFAVITLAMIATWACFIVLQETWYSLIVAAALGILFTQYAFLAHEASHRQVFESGKVNDYSGRMLADLFVGISYSWWMNKHTRHHANPNTIGKDPDIEPDFIIFKEEDAVGLRGFKKFFTTHQGWFFFPAILGEGLNLHIQAFRTVFSRGKVDKRALEIVLLTVRNLTYLTVVFYFLPLGMAFAFVAVQLAIFGLYMGAAFVPNHTGMPFLARDSKVDFLRRQVLTSRNIRGGWFMNIFMGGLNFQTEHHLFPSMPRPHLRRAAEIVKEYCESREIAYTETSLPQAYGIITRYLNRVGLAAMVMPGDCPVAASLGR